MPSTPDKTTSTPIPGRSPSFSETTPADATPAPRKKGRLVTPILALVAALVVGGFAGLLIGQNTASSSTAAGPGGFTQGERPDGASGQGGGGFGGATSGTVVSNADGTLTVETADGETVTVTTSGDTTVTTTDESSVDALAEGDTVTIIGETGDDDSVAATRITEGDVAAGGFPGGGAAPTDAPED